MKKATKALIIGLFLTIASAPQASTLSGSDSSGQLTKAYQTFAVMNESEYHFAMDRLIQAAQDEGKHREAALFELLRNDRAARSQVLDKIQEKIETSADEVASIQWCQERDVGEINCSFAAALLSL